jgi:SOS response regulatory protein OraA/RecX
MTILLRGKKRYHSLIFFLNFRLRTEKEVRDYLHKTAEKFGLTEGVYARSSAGTE